MNILPTIIAKSAKRKVQKKKFLFSFFFLAVIFSFSFYALRWAYGQETVRIITISPPTAPHTLNPGDKTEGRVKITNYGEKALTFAVSVEDFIVEDKKGTPTILPPNTLNKKYSGASWIGVYPQSFTLEPHQTQIVNYFAQVPKDAKPGGHYAAIVYTPTTTLGVNGSGASVNTELGTLFYLTVNGPITEKSTLSMLANFFQEYGPVKVTTVVKNMGDLHIRPDGKVTVSNLFGSKTIQNLPPGNVFPETERDYENTFGSKWMFGPYTAKFTGTYGRNNNLQLASSVTFWVFPWKIALVIILIITAIILTVMLMRKKKTPPTTPQPAVKAEPAAPTTPTAPQATKQA